MRDGLLQSINGGWRVPYNLWVKKHDNEDNIYLHIVEQSS